MLNDICYVLACLVIGGIWGYRIREGVQKKDRFGIIYSFVLCIVMIAMMILKIIELVKG